MLYVNHHCHDKSFKEKSGGLSLLLKEKKVMLRVINTVIPKVFARMPAYK